MTQPENRSTKGGLESCVPDSILHALEHSKRGRRPVPMLRSENWKHQQAVKVPPVLKATTEHSEAAFLDSVPQSQETLGRRIPAPSSPDRITHGHHTYGCRRGSPSRPRKQERLADPVRSIDASRQQMVDKMQRNSVVSERVQHKLEQQGFMEEAMHGIAAVMSVDISSGTGSRERSQGSAKPFHGRRRTGREQSPGKSRSFSDRAMGEPQDSIDMFLTSSSVSPAPGGQRVVTDLTGELGDSLKRQKGPSPTPAATADARTGNQIYATALTEYSYVTGDMEGDLEERIGQYGGLIPTLYTMDKLNPSSFLAKRKTIVKPKNRYSITITTKDSKVTGAGFKRQVSSKARAYVPTSPVRRPRLEDASYTAPPQDMSHPRAAAGVPPNGLVRHEGALTYSAE